MNESENLKKGLKKFKLGELLVKAGYISVEQLEKALKEQKEHGGKLGEILIKLGMIKEEHLMKALSEQFKIPFIDLKQYSINQEIVQKLPERIARRYRAILLDANSGMYTIGMSDPTDLVGYDEIVRELGGIVQLAIVSESDLLHIFDFVYRRTDDISSFAKALKEELVVAEGTDSVVPEAVGADAAPVVKLLDSIFEDAVQMGASDVHIEPDEKLLRIRQRIDGVLHEYIIPGKEIVAALVLRVKLMANMNISEKRLPQDGRFGIAVKGQNLDVRVAIMPVHFGEAVVMRLLNQSTGILKLEQLGMEKMILEKIKGLICKPNGMILVTGPTGSGKTTSLYAMLNELNQEEKKIITIEDPIEYVLPRVNQVQVNSAINLNFSDILRSAMRHDPDIIMVGEIRDEETASIGLRAAMTGHLVFSTLHTNNSIDSTLRLIDMGSEGFLVASAVRGVLAQALVRKNCEFCSETYIPTEHEQIWIKGTVGGEEHSFTFKRGVGCSRCNRSGYRGRTGVYEFLEIKPELAAALRANDTNLFLKLASSQPDRKSLVQSAFECAAQGITTLSEVFRIAGELA